MEGQGEERGIVYQCILAKIFQYDCDNFIGQVPYMALDVAALHFFWHAETTNDLCMKTDKHLLLFFTVGYGTGIVQFCPELIKFIINYKLFFPSYL